MVPDDPGGRELDATRFGLGTWDQTSLRRSICVTVIRSNLIPLPMVFDARGAMQGIGGGRQLRVPQRCYVSISVAWSMASAVGEVSSARGVGKVLPDQAGQMPEALHGPLAGGPQPSRQLGKR